MVRPVRYMYTVQYSGYQYRRQGIKCTCQPALVSMNKLLYVKEVLHVGALIEYLQLRISKSYSSDNMSGGVVISVTIYFQLR